VLFRSGQDKNTTALTHIELERSNTHSPGSPITLSVSPNPWLGNTETCQISITPQGLKPADSTEGPATEDTLQRLRSLINMLPLALMDSVQHGANKNLLKPWAQTLRELRTWAQQNPTAPAKQRPTKAKPPTKSKPPTKAQTSTPAKTKKLPNTKAVAKTTPTSPALKAIKPTVAKPATQAGAKPAAKAPTPRAAPRKEAQKPISRTAKA
jgi:hypothetical protein